ncbi:MAG: hypothetical protein AAGA30_02910, partial [Planctomycetota bacterium]
EVAASRPAATTFDPRIEIFSQPTCDGSSQDYDWRDKTGDKLQTLSTRVRYNGRSELTWSDFMRSFFCCLVIFLFPATSNAQLKQIKKAGEFSGAGMVEDIQAGEITIRSKSGKSKSFLIQNKDERFVSLDGNDYIVSMPSKIKVAGRLPGKLLEKGMKVRFIGEINRGGRTGKPVTEIKVVSDNSVKLKLNPKSMPGGKEMVACEFIGIIQRFTNQRMYLVVPKTNLSPDQRVTVKVDEKAFFDIEADDLNRVKAGDTINQFRGDRMANGALVIRDIDITLTAEREVATTSFSDQLYLKHSKLSDEPVDPREERSTHFVLYTDVSPRSAQVLLDKLETMYGFLGRYYRKRPREVIECYVVSDLDKFRGKLPSFAVTKIEERAGVTSSQQYALLKGNRIKKKMTQSVVYSCDDHGVVQHEAVHAYCSMAFGTAGPVWYAEGMAEMGQYFAPEQPFIQIDPVVIEYLTTAPKKEILDIIAAGQITGDSWKAYSWRWALCHLLAHNPNYSKRFRELGVNLMMEKQDSFDSKFGDDTKKIAFEYDQFVANFDNGYRTDLCVWQWPETVRKIKDRGRFSVDAKKGWQATALFFEEGETYDFICPNIKNETGKRVQQTWTIKENQKAITPEGNSRGDGKLIGAIFKNYQLSEEFEIGSKSVGLKVPKSGHLYVRCREKWSSIADNEGEIQVFVRKTP